MTKPKGMIPTKKPELIPQKTGFPYFNSIVMKSIEDFVSQMRVRKEARAMILPSHFATCSRFFVSRYFPTISIPIWVPLPVARTPPKKVLKKTRCLTKGSVQ